jgi:hypothetical protein
LYAYENSDEILKVFSVGQNERNRLWQLVRFAGWAAIQRFTLLQLPCTAARLIPADDAMIAVLEDHRDDPVVQELVAVITSMSLDEQIDLVALTWLGRGDGGVEDWSELRAEAARALPGEHGPKDLSDGLLCALRGAADARRGQGQTTVITATTIGRRRTLRTIAASLPSQERAKLLSNELRYAGALFNRYV